MEACVFERTSTPHKRIIRWMGIRGIRRLPLDLRHANIMRCMQTPRLCECINRQNRIRWSSHIHFRLEVGPDPKAYGLSKGDHETRPRFKTLPWAARIMASVLMIGMHFGDVHAYHASRSWGMHHRRPSRIQCVDRIGLYDGCVIIDGSDAI